MINTQIALLRRELIEHRAIYVVPLVVAILMTLIWLTGQVSVNHIDAIDFGIIGAANLPENARSILLGALMFLQATPFIFAMCILIVFYALDSLYAERKDRSILFWRSIPVTDFETVLSKLLTIIVAIPLVTFAIVSVTHLVILLNMSLWVEIRGGSAWSMIWGSMPFVDTWAVTLAMLVAIPLWLSPLIGWFLFVSAYTNRSPLLIGALPIVMLPLVEKIFFDSTFFFNALIVRTVQMPLFEGRDNIELLLPENEDFSQLADANINLFQLLDLGGFLADPQLWLGLVVCGLFVAAAIYVRRYRDDA